MIKHILTRMYYEGASNTAILLELFLIALFLWYAIDLGYVQIRNFIQPPGWDVEHTYQIRLREVQNFEAEYRDGVTEEEQSDAIWDFYNRIKDYKGVEAVSLSFGAMPGTSVKSFEIFYTKYGTFERGDVSSPSMTPSFVDVFRIASVDGESEAIKVALSNERLLASEDVKGLFGTPKSTIVGDTIYSNPSLTQVSNVIGAMAVPMKNNRYSVPSPFIATPIAEGSELFFPSYSELCIRVKKSEMSGFAERFETEVGKSLTKANIQYDGLQYLPSSFGEGEREMKNQLLLNALLLLFLLLNIMIGVVGVFSNKAQRSIGEIGLRISFGSTPSGAIGMFVAEGLIILSLAFVLAAGVVGVLYGIEFPDTSLVALDLSRYIHVLLIVLLLMSGTVVLGVWMPTRKVVDLPPADALREE